MSKFGWSYPPGCSGGPFDGAPEPSALQEAVLQLLEAAGIDTDINDKIVALIEDGEIKKIIWDEAIALSDDEMKAQAARCGCRGCDEYCVCQNVPDRTTLAARGLLRYPNQ